MRPFCRLGAVAVCLLSTAMAHAESHVTGAGARRAAAAAHVDFKIVIPQTLSLVFLEAAPGAGARMAIGGNVRTVSVTTTGLNTAGAGNPPAGVTPQFAILNAAGHRSVAATAVCTAPARRTLCTLSMP